MLNMEVALIYTDKHCAKEVATRLYVFWIMIKQYLINIICNENRKLDKKHQMYNKYRNCFPIKKQILQTAWVKLY